MTALSPVGVIRPGSSPGSRTKFSIQFEYTLYIINTEDKIMAIRVQYWENNKPEHYIEGPFVMVNPLGFKDGWRIEVERKNHKCSVLPDSTIYALLDNKYRTAFNSAEHKIAASVDWLNMQYKIGNIIQDKLGNYFTK